MSNAACAKLEATINQIKNVVDVNTVIGQPIVVGEVTILPVSKVTYGFASGGSDFPSSGSQELFGGCGGAGVTITPVAFLLIQNGEVTLKHITAYDNAAERMVNLVPDMFDKVTGFINRNK